MIHRVKDFLQHHMDMLRVARHNVWQAHDCYKKYANAYQRPVTFYKGDYVFPWVSKHPKRLNIGPTPKLLTQFCGPLHLLKRIGKVAYKLDLSTSKVHLIFHVNCLRKWLYNEDDVVKDDVILVEFTKPPSQPHKPKKILDCHELRTHHHVCLQVLVMWKDSLDKGST